MASKLSSLDPIERRTFYIGLLAQVWAMIETHIDVACEAALLDLGGRDKFDVLPRSMSRKIKLLRYVHNNSEKLAAFREPTVRILDSAGEAAEQRNGHIYAAALGALDGSGSAFLLQYKYQPDGLDSQYRTVTLSDLLDDLHEGRVLMDAVPLVVRLTLEACGRSVPDELGTRPHSDQHQRPSPTRREKQIVLDLQRLRKVRWP